MKCALQCACQQPTYTKPRYWQLIPMGKLGRHRGCSIAADLSVVESGRYVGKSSYMEGGVFGRLTVIILYHVIAYLVIGKVYAEWGFVFVFVGVSRIDMRLDSRAVVAPFSFHSGMIYRFQSLYFDYEQNLWWDVSSVTQCAIRAYRNQSMTGSLNLALRKSLWVRKFFLTIMWALNVYWKPLPIWHYYRHVFCALFVANDTIRIVYTHPEM